MFVHFYLPHKGLAFQLRILPQQNTALLSSVCRPCVVTGVTSPLYDVLDHTNHTFSESSWSKDIKTELPSVSYTNTQIQIHKYKYTNIPYDKVPKRPNIWIRQVLS